MGKHFIHSVTGKLLCLTLSVMLIAGSLPGAALADSDQPAGAASGASPVLLTCETGGLELADNGRSVEIHLCLTQEDEGIRQKIYREDVVLGGVFRDMIVSGVRNDRKTILLDLIGVPDLSGESGNTALEGTMEFPGALFGCDDSVTVSTGVTGKEGTPEEDMKPSFYPYVDSMREDEETVEMYIVLMPTLGEFAGDFSADDISFARGLRDANIRMFRASGNGYRELLVSVPKEGMKPEEGGFSCFGSIILSRNSMVSPGGKTYEKRLCAVREYSVEMTGRGAPGQDDVNSMKNDVRAVKDFVDLFGDTSFGTIAKTTYGGLSAVSAGYTVLSLVGILPSASSSGALIMKELQNIQYTLSQIDEKCDYMTGVLDSHTKMITDMGVKLDEQYLGGFNAEFGSMVDAMDLLEDEITNPWVKRQIEEAIERVAERYETEQTGMGRDLDEAVEIIMPGSEYYDNIRVNEWDVGGVADPGLFEVMVSDSQYDDSETEIADEYASEDDTVEEVFADEAANAGTGPAEGEGFEEADAGAESFAEDTEIFEDEEEILEEVTEDVPEGRILDAYDTQMFLMDLNREIGKINLTANITIGDLLRRIASSYSTLSRRFDTNDSSNPIVAFCSAHEGTDNFATTSLPEKELYEQNIKYQFFRALTILSAMDSPTAYRRAITSLQNKDEQHTWPDVAKGTKDGKGNPYCFLTQSYVRLATQSEIEAWYDPLKKKNKEKVQVTNKSGQNVSTEEFYRRMHGRTLEKELERAEITNLKAVREDGSRGLTFSFERWGVKYGYRKYERSYYAWTDGVRLADADSVYDNVLWGGQLLKYDDSYIIVATPYIRWTAGLGDVPAEAYLYQDKNDQMVKYRLTTLVTP